LSKIPPKNKEKQPKIKGFARIPNYIAQDPNISALARATIVYLQSRGRKWEPTRDDIKSNLNFSKWTWEKISKELTKIGILSNTLTKQGKKLNFNIDNFINKPRPGGQVMATNKPRPGGRVMGQDPEKHEPRPGTQDPVAGSFIKKHIIKKQQRSVVARARVVVVEKKQKNHETKSPNCEKSTIPDEEFETLCKLATKYKISRDSKVVEKIKWGMWKYGFQEMKLKITNTQDKNNPTGFLIDAIVNNYEFETAGESEEEIITRANRAYEETKKLLEHYASPVRTTEGLENIKKIKAMLQSAK